MKAISKCYQMNYDTCGTNIRCIPVADQDFGGRKIWVNKLRHRRPRSTRSKLYMIIFATGAYTTYTQYLAQNTNQRASQPVIEFIAFIVQYAKNIAYRAILHNAPSIFLKLFRLDFNSGTSTSGKSLHVHFSTIWMVWFQ